MSKSQCSYYYLQVPKTHVAIFEYKIQYHLCKMKETNMNTALVKYSIFLQHVTECSYIQFWVVNLSFKLISLRTAGVLEWIFVLQTLV